MTGFIYKIENKTNQHIYIGSTVYYKKRSREHLQMLVQNKHHSIKMQRAYNKCLIKNFECSIIESFDFVNKEHLLSREQFYIDTLLPEYNMTYLAGSMLGYKHTAEFKRKQAIIYQSKPFPSTKGIKKSKESVEKRALANTGKKRSKEQIERIKNARPKFTHSEETIAKMRKAQTGVKRGKYKTSKKHSEESKQKKSASLKKFYEKNSHALKGKTISKEASEKRKESCLRYCPSVSKLTEEQAFQIKNTLHPLKGSQLWEQQRFFAKEFSVCLITIQRIKWNLSWKHIKI